MNLYWKNNWIMLRNNVVVYALLLLMVGCGQNNKMDELVTPEGKWMGLTLTDTVPSIFSPGFISTGLPERDATFSPGGDEFCFSVTLGDRFAIMTTRLDKNGHWTNPRVIGFSGKYKDIEPAFSHDGTRMFFSSNRPVNEADTTDDFDIWYVDRLDGGWSEPVNPGSPLNGSGNEFYPSVTREGHLYFCAEYPFGTGAEDIYRSEYRNGQYMQPEILGDSVNTPSWEYNAFIAPDESYLIYTTHGWGQGFGRGDLWITRKSSEGYWEKPVNLGNAINSEQIDYCPSVTPDGKYFKFTSQRSNTRFDNEIITYGDLREAFHNPGNGMQDIYVMDAGIVLNMK